jgi:hypothetical protein
MSGPVDGGGYTLGKPALQQIGEVVRAFNGGGGASATRKFPYRAPAGLQTVDAIVTNTISPCVVANNGQITYGTGTAQVMMPVMSNNAIIAQNDSTYGNVQVLSFAQNSNSVTAGTHILLVWRGVQGGPATAGGYWGFGTGDC